MREERVEARGGRGNELMRDEVSELGFAQSEEYGDGSLLTVLIRSSNKGEGERREESRGMLAEQTEEL